MNKSNDISQIRNLIFGEEMDKIDSHFKEIDDHLSKLGKRMDEMTARINDDKKSANETAQTIEGQLKNAVSDIQKQIETMQAELTRRMDALQLSTAARTELAEMFSQFADRLTAHPDK